MANYLFHYVLCTHLCNQKTLFVTLYSRTSQRILLQLCMYDYSELFSAETAQGSSYIFPEAQHQKGC